MLLMKKGTLTPMLFMMKETNKSTLLSKKRYGKKWLLALDLFLDDARGQHDLSLELGLRGLGIQPRQIRVPS